MQVATLIFIILFLFQLQHQEFYTNLYSKKKRKKNEFNTNQIDSKFRSLIHNNEKRTLEKDYHQPFKIFSHITPQLDYQPVLKPKMNASQLLGVSNHF